MLDGLIRIQNATGAEKTEKYPSRMKMRRKCCHALAAGRGGNGWKERGHAA
jgi:hypothetical protein